MKKLIIIIGYALTTQVIHANDLRKELRNIEDQNEEIIEQNEKITEQNERLASQLQSDNLNRQLDNDRIERKRIFDRQIEDSRIQSERIKREVSEMSDAEVEANARALGLKPDTVRFGPVVKSTPEPKPLPPLILPSTGLDDYEVLEKLPADAVILPPLPPGYVLDKPYVIDRQNADGTITVTKLPK